jgi:5-methylcytosine-specific restriction endonuclease McrA
MLANNIDHDSYFWDGLEARMRGVDKSENPLLPQIVKEELSDHVSWNRGWVFADSIIQEGSHELHRLKKRYEYEVFYSVPSSSEFNQYVSLLPNMASHCEQSECGFSEYLGVLVQWDEDRDTRVLSFIESLDDETRAELAVVQEHEGSIAFVWKNKIPYGYQDGDGIVVEGDWWTIASSDIAPKKPYRELLKDPRWQRKRLEIFNRDRFKCVRCGSDHKTLHVHHKFYNKNTPPWEYGNDCLVTLCEDCHSSEHGRDK